MRYVLSFWSSLQDLIYIQLQKGQIDDLMWFLIERMLQRESEKFGGDVERVTTQEQRVNFVAQFLGEVARDLADNQTEAISADSLTWIAEIAGSGLFPEELLYVIKNRASAIVFLIDDNRPGFKRFSHTQLMNHFLARIMIPAVTKGEILKYIRRNLFDADFLPIFNDLVRNLESEALAFVRVALQKIAELSDHDRARRNLASLVLAAASIVDDADDSNMTDVALDEGLITETVGKLKLVRVTIVQLDARGADLHGLIFGEGCHVFSLIADAGTAVPKEFPRPQRVQLVDLIIHLTHPR